MHKASKIYKKTYISNLYNFLTDLTGYYRNVSV